MNIEQIRVGIDNFSYLVHCPNTKLAVLIDTSFDSGEALKFISTNELELKYIINTHNHNDHTGDNSRVKNAHDCEIIASSAAGGHEIRDADRLVEDGEEIKMGEITLKFIHTPGHTQDGLCIIVDDEAIITGDTLFIGDCGRTDLLGGNIAQMFQSLHEKIMVLPDHLVVYPGHDYGDKPFDTLGNQKNTNKTLLARNLKQFSEIP